MNSEITHVNIFDFDDTLFRIQNFACDKTHGMTMYEWYDNPISLSPEFNILGIENILEKARDESKSRNFLISHRALSCRQEVERLLNDRNCKFEDLIFLERGQNKADPVIELISNNPSIRTILIFEDTLYEIMKYAHALRMSMNSDVKVDYMFVDKSKIIPIPGHLAEQIWYISDGEEERIRLT